MGLSETKARRGLGSRPWLEGRNGSPVGGLCVDRVGHGGIPFSGIPSHDQPLSSDLELRIQSDLADARRARDKPATVLLSTTLSELRNRRIEQRGQLSDQDAIEVLVRAVKQREEAAEQMRAGGREELASREESEAVRLREYLPSALEEDAVRQMVREIVASGADSLGAVMGALMPRLKGRFDGREANRIVREELSP